MKLYRLHDLLRAGAATWLLAACGSSANAGGGTVDAAADSGADIAAADVPTADLATVDSAPSDSSPADGPTADAGTPSDAPVAADVPVAPDVPDTADIAVKPDVTADSKPAAPFPCVDPQPIVVQGQDTGVDICQNGMQHRRAIKTCPAYVPDPAKKCPMDNGGQTIEGMCKTDLDCSKTKGGHCETSQGGMAGCFCQPSCQTDADCGAAEVCLCGPVFGKCVPATCTSDADCPVGLCGTFTTNPGCGGPALACQTAEDECGGDKQCPVDKHYCTIADYKMAGKRVCSGATCAIGRPFEVAGSWRTAPVVQRQDWLQKDDIAAIELGGLGPELRARLAQHWLDAAQMEHASVASFARLTLELLAIGAPPELLQRSQAAGMDEVRHAQLCFALARHLGAGEVGPGPLAIGGALGEATLTTVAVAAAREGCIVETVAALEAHVMAAQTLDPVLKRLLTALADDESRHAELAWDIVRWTVKQGDAPLRQAVAAAMDEATADLLAAEVAAEVPVGLGLIGGAAQRSLRLHAVTAVLAPARRATLTNAVIS